MSGVFAFETSPWELYLESVKRGAAPSAARMLALLEGDSQDAVEEAFEDLKDLHIIPTLGDLPLDIPDSDTGKRMVLEEKLYKSGALLTDLPEEDPLRLFLEELSRIPVCGDEELLAAEVAEAKGNGTADEKMQTRLANLSLSRVVELAGEYMNRGLLLLDLIQEGSMGLWNAILSYSGQDAFCLVRDWWIRYYMTKAVILQARENGVGANLRRDLEEYRAADRKLLDILGRNATPEEIAREMGVTGEKAQVLEDMLLSARILEKAHAPAPEPTPEDEQPVEDTAYFQSRQRILDLLSSLNEQEAQVLTLRFGLEGGMPCTAQQVAEKLHLSREKVVALESAALKKLRNVKL